MLFTWTIDRHISARPYTSARAIAIIRRMHKLPVSLRHSFWGPPSLLRDCVTYARVRHSIMHAWVSGTGMTSLAKVPRWPLKSVCSIFLQDIFSRVQTNSPWKWHQVTLTSNISRRTCFRTPLLIYQNASGPNFTFLTENSYWGAINDVILRLWLCVNLLVQLAFSEW